MHTCSNNCKGRQQRTVFKVGEHLTNYLQVVLVIGLKISIRKFFIRYSKNSFKMLSVRLIFLVFAIALICEDSLGGDLNDRIDQVLAVMVRINKNVETLTDKVNGMEQKVNGVTKQVGEVTKQVGDIKKHMDSGISDVKNEINIIDAKVEKVDNDVLYNTWKFVGRGYEVSVDSMVRKDGTTMKECLKWCQTKRMGDGGEWNGVIWYEPNGCRCNKNDRGHEVMPGCLHFRAQ